MADKPPMHKQGVTRYDRLLRGEITSKQYVKSLKQDARAARPKASARGSLRAGGAS